ncbi:hypothetical protein [Glaciimonas sp. PCH181]|uniref:hypothetical protein n=1 Tax=Glaciimonas sp. PCH181 TaxID=2133943 RepID=UPI000D384462|nr:hypothetical protein [Glaciimonas sp. PCH181]PUA18682.1 hypothetical protein C7W93_01755 [Glaciimonas sp. PCH181]
MHNDLISRIVSLVLAIGIVTGIVWMMSKSIVFPEKVKTPTPAASEPMPSSAKNNAYSPPPNTDPARTFSQELPQPPQAAQSGQIYKCESNHKATYSDQKCLSTEQTTTVKIRESSGGFVSPDQQTIAETRERIRLGMSDPGAAVITNKRVSGMTNNMQGQCYYLANEIDVIDATSRHRLTGQEQQRLRIRRGDIRARQYRLGC